MKSRVNPTDLTDMLIAMNAIVFDILSRARLSKEEFERAIGDVRIFIYALVYALGIEDEFINAIEPEGNAEKRNALKEYMRLSFEGVVRSLKR